MSKRIKYNRILGFYKPAFFFMELGVEADFDKILYNPKSESVFYHEYIHFLQDVLTTYGINNMRSILVLLRDKIAYMQKNAFQELPVNFSSHIVSDFNKQFEYTYGINNENHMKILESINEFTPITNIEVKTEYLGDCPLDIYYLSFEGMPYKYQLGSIDIIEGMAFALEKQTFMDDSYDSPTLPYKTIQMLIRHLCPYSFPSMNFIIALCEISLSSGNPMMYFMETLMKFKVEMYKPINFDDFLYEISENRQIACNGNNYTNPNDVYFMIINNVKEELEYIFGRDEYFKNILLWLNTLLSNMMTIRMTDTLPITNFFYNADRRDVFHNLICNKIGTPIIYISDNKHGYYFDINNASGELFFLRVLQNFFDSLYDGCGCLLEEYCNEKSKIEGTSDFTDKNCYLSPSLRSDDKKYKFLCPYAALWKYFGLPINVNFKNNV